MLIVDDVLATGGTARAACDLVEGVGGGVCGCAFVLAIAALRGEEAVGERRVEQLLKV